jgi:XTP/dITP diphosphohydrolase
MKLLIGSHNPAKIEEYKRYLSDFSFELLSLSDLKIKLQAPEDADSFEANAINKAKFYQKLSGLSTIAEDAGLMIDALNGAPGVKSRRWLGYEMTDEELIQMVIDKMKNVPEEKRTCHLVAVIALAMADGRVYTQWAQIDGIIAKTPTEKRQEGFPYRSILYLPEFKKFYMDLTDEEHEKINHRRLALIKLKPYLETLSIQQAYI